jgi:hypothetical protein
MVTRKRKAGGRDMRTKAGRKRRKLGPIYLSIITSPEHENWSDEKVLAKLDEKHLLKQSEDDMNTPNVQKEIKTNEKDFYDLKNKIKEEMTFPELKDAKKSKVVELYKDKAIENATNKRIKTTAQSLVRAYKSNLNKANNRKIQNLNNKICSQKVTIKKLKNKNAIQENEIQELLADHENEIEIFKDTEIENTKNDNFKPIFDMNMNTGTPEMKYFCVKLIGRDKVAAKNVNSVLDTLQCATGLPEIKTFTSSTYLRWVDTFGDQLCTKQVM